MPPKDTRECHYCYTQQKFRLVEEVPDELHHHAHRHGKPLRTADKQGLLDIEFRHVDHTVVVFAKHKGPCGLPCIGSYEHKAAKFEAHPGQSCAEAGCAGKVRQKHRAIEEHRAQHGFHDGSNCPCNAPSGAA